MKYLLRIKNAVSSLTQPNPLRDWFIVLCLLVALLLTLIGVSVYFFVGIQSGGILGEPDTEIKRTQTVSRKTLEDVVNTYEARRVNYEAGNISAPDVRDPS